MKVGDVVLVKDNVNSNHAGVQGTISVVRSWGTLWVDFSDGESVPYNADELEVVEEAQS